MYPYIYKDKKTGRNVYSHIPLKNADLELIKEVRNMAINPAKNQENIKLKGKK